MCRCACVFWSRDETWEDVSEEQLRGIDKRWEVNQLSLDLAVDCEIMINDR